jgi:hypothetical protein
MIPKKLALAKAGVADFSTKSCANSGIASVVGSTLSKSTVMQMTLTSQGEKLLRLFLARHLGQSPAEIVEQALARHVQQETVAALPLPNSPAELEAVLDALAAHSDKIPLLPDRAFSRESLYQDHD